MEEISNAPGGPSERTSGSFMSDFRDYPTAVRAGEELDLARLEPYLLGHFPGGRGPLAAEQFPAVIPT